MEPNEIVKTEDVITTVEVATANSDFGLGVAVGAGAFLGGTLLYRYAIRPIVAKIKAAWKRKQAAQVYDIGDAQDVEYQEAE